MRFPIRFTGANQLMGVLGMTPSRCYVEVDERQLRGWMGPVPLRVRVLRVSVEDPVGIVAALASPTPSDAPTGATGGDGDAGRGTAGG
jgi:hypothetical protein